MLYSYFKYSINKKILNETARLLKKDEKKFHNFVNFVSGTPNNIKSKLF
jgi:hypothetical protein